jgi:CheY-like chemotaxis protein
MIADLSGEEAHLNVIKFKNGELISVLQVINLDALKFSGYFRITFSNSHEKDRLKLDAWHLFFSKGKLVFSSNKEIRLVNILEVLQNYIPNFRDTNLKYKNKLNEILCSVKDKDEVSILRLLTELTLKTGLVEYQEITQAIQKHLLSELDLYLFDFAGNVKIVFDKTIDYRRPVIGFDLEQIIFLAKQRRIQLQKLREVIPSLSCSVKCNEQNAHWKALPSGQQQKIKQLVSSGNNLEEIRYKLGEDSLKIVKTFAKLIDKKLVVLDSGIDDLDISLIDRLPLVPEVTKVSIPKVAIIDDSPVLLKNFEKIVTDWGYSVRCCNDALAAVNFLLESPPEIVFLDVNMPNISGFQLMKVIRLQPELSTIPLVVLTAEKTLMNRQRAKWAKSVFLTKPTTNTEIDSFKSDLKSLLQTMLPIK